MKEQLLTNYLSGECSEEEKKQVEEMIQTSPFEKVEFQKMEKIWLASAQFTPDTRAAFRIVEKEISKDAEKIKKIFYWAAAIVILGIGIHFLTTGIWHTTEWKTVTSLNEKKNILLPDGSSLWLNKNSSLKYSITESGKRICQLSGEAYFEVARMESRPFYVETNFSTVQVLGTSFNVKTKTEQDILSVLSGKVLFSEKDNKSNSVTVTAGQASVYNYPTHTLQIENMEKNSIAWKTGILHFSDMSLNKVAEVLEEYYEVEIQVDEPLQGCLLNTTLNNLSLEDALIVIQKTLNVTIQTVDTKIFITGKRCQ